MLAPAPSRSACVPFVGDGAYARREALKDLPLRCAQDFLVFASKARYAPIPLRLRTFCWGWVLRSQGSSEGSTTALRAGFFGVRFLCSLRPHPAPPAYLLLGMGPTLAGNVGTGWAFALNARGGSGCRRSYARYGPIPLRLRTFCWGWGLRSQGTLGEAWAFALNARGGSGCRRSYARSGPIPLRQRRMPLAQWPNPVPAPVPDKVLPQGSPARFPGKVDGPGRLSAARNFRQGQGGSGCVYPLRYSPPDPTQ
jgi:hypothetical protein